MSTVYEHTKQGLIPWDGRAWKVGTSYRIGGDMTYDASKSAQPCGCDEGAKHICEWHRGFLGMEPAPLSPERRYENHPVDCKPYTPNIQFVGPGAVIKYNPLLPKPSVGIGGAPTRATTLPEDAAGRKQHPVASGVLDYFPDALVAVSNVSWAGNEQHNPGQPLHWARGKSTDESDTMIRHFLQRGTRDTDGQRHSAKMVWRALAILQKEIEGESR